MYTIEADFGVTCIVIFLVDKQKVLGTCSVVVMQELNRCTYLILTTTEQICITHFCLSIMQV